MQFRVSPIIYVFQSIDTAALFSFNDSDFQNPTFNIDLSSGKITVEFIYSEDIEGRNFQLQIRPSLSSDPRFFATSDQSWTYTLTSG